MSQHRTEHSLRAGDLLSLRLDRGHKSSGADGFLACFGFADEVEMSALEVALPKDGDAAEGDFYGESVFRIDPGPNVASGRGAAEKACDGSVDHTK